jgi:dienelactone hydrolase
MPAFETAFVLLTLLFLPSAAAGQGSAGAGPHAHGSDRPRDPQAVTYLERREDIERGRIAVAGMSFGGITAFYTWLVDPRVWAASSICGGVGSIDVLLRTGRPAYHGFYWWIPGMLTRGDQADFAAAAAPGPLMLWAPQRDIGMPKEGVDRSPSGW